MRVWRITKVRHAETAYSGEGARLYSARWNPAGVHMVYSATSLALAALEVFVHLEPQAEPNDLVSVAAELPVAIENCERINPATLPKDWKAERHPELQKIGEAWARSGRSLILLVPSAVIDGDWNALLNPQHEDATKIAVETAQRFYFDPRMLKIRVGS